MNLEWIPERYPPSGTIGAAGFYKLLGRPQLDPLTVLVRETAQNSWDARRPRKQTVYFSMDGRQLLMEEREELVGAVLQNRELAAGTGLSSLPSNCTALFITDRGTLGLGGPLSASEVSGNNVYDWVDFVLNVGKANTQGHTGGTYGFGKTIAYVVSAVNTVVVYSRAKHEGRLQTRLMACAIGSEFKHDGALYTGRHWWGVGDNGAPTPATDARADELARRIGMPQFSGGDTGTTLMVIEPDFGDRTPEQGMNFLVEAALWNLWPKLVPQPDRPVEMNISFSWNGSRLTLPSPDERPPLGGFVQAFQEMLLVAAEDARPPGFQMVSIGLERPKKIVGALATVPLITRDRPAIDDGHVPSDSNSPRPAAPIEGPAHHVALLRSPNLVVEYLDGPPSPEPNFEWVGVFKAVDDEDHVFALAEPPTHDTWRPELIPDRTDKSIVKMALQNVRKALDLRWGARTEPVAEVSASTSSVAHRLAHLVAGVPGTGAEPLISSRSGGPTQRRAKLEVVSSGPTTVGEQLATQITVAIVPLALARTTELHIRVGVALAGGGTDVGADPSLQLSSARMNDELLTLNGSEATLIVEGDKPVDVTIVATRSAELSVSFDVQLGESTSR